jgi:hypothetical protein
MSRSRLDVKQAAQILGISTDAVHKRAKRGTLESEKDEDGRVFVWLDTEDNGYTSSSLGDADVHPLLLTRLENENDFLRRELDRRAEELSEMRRIVAGLVQRVPGLEGQRDAQPDDGDGDLTASEAADSGAVRDDEKSEPRRSWWRVLFGA